MKKLIRYITFFIGIGFVLISFFALSQKIAIQSTLKHNKEIQVMLDSTAKYISSLKELPTHQELQNWLNSQKTSTIDYKLLQYEVYDENFALNKNIPKDEYILSMWRGEWNEYYYSWKKKKSTIPSDESVYYITGYILGDFLVFFLIGLLFFKISSILKRP